MVKQRLHLEVVVGATEEPILAVVVAVALSFMKYMDQLEFLVAAALVS
jgi:hypothetical protein